MTKRLLVITITLSMMFAFAACGGSSSNNGIN